MEASYNKLNLVLTNKHADKGILDIVKKRSKLGNFMANESEYCVTSTNTPRPLLNWVSGMRLLRK
jgi:hypothetical protein